MRYFWGKKPFSILLVILSVLAAGCSAGAGLRGALPTASPTFPPPGVTVQAAATRLPAETQAAPAGSGASTPVPTAQPPASNPSGEAPTQTPSPAVMLRQLTTGGCCVQPAWSPDGSTVLFIDKPAPEAPSGLWGVRLDGGEPELFTDRLGIYSADMQLRAFPQNGQTMVERLSDGQQWVIPSEGRAVSFSPDGSRVAWTAGQNGPPFDTARRVVWISQADGSQAQEVIRLFSGGFAGWFPDGRLLVSGRRELAEETTAYWVVSPAGGEPLEIARGHRLRGALISPGGSWLAYLVAFSSTPEENGLWLANTQSGERRRLEVFGAYRWRDDGRLLVVPLEVGAPDAGAPSHRLLQVEAKSGESSPLTDPLVTPFKIANGDWSVSPDGRRIAFISAQDHNIWLIDLEE